MTWFQIDSKSNFHLLHSFDDSSTTFFDKNRIARERERKSERRNSKWIRVKMNLICILQLFIFLIEGKSRRRVKSSSVCIFYRFAYLSVVVEWHKHVCKPINLITLGQCFSTGVPRHSILSIFEEVYNAICKKISFSRSFSKIF